MDGWMDVGYIGGEEFVGFVGFASLISIRRFPRDKQEDNDELAIHVYAQCSLRL